MKDNMIKNASVSAVRRNLNVENATSELDGSIEGLHEAVYALEAHLAPLLSPETPCGVVCDRAQGGISELAERILANSDRVHNASARIRELIDRL